MQVGCYTCTDLPPGHQCILEPFPCLWPGGETQQAVTRQKEEDGDDNNNKIVIGIIR